MQKTISLPSIIVLLLALNLSGCSTLVGSRAVEKYNQNPLTVPIPAGLAAEQVEAVMKQTLIARGWTLGQISPEQTDGSLTHRSFQAKVSLVANDGVIQILSHSLYVSEDEDTQPGVPKGWLANLQKDLTKHLDVASRSQ